MAVPQIGSVFTPTTTTSSGTAQKSFDASVETYLNLFLTQLKNQDPTEPFSTEAMTQQMSMLTQTQQTIEMNKNIESLIAMNSNSQATAVASFIGKDVEYVSDEFYSDGKGAEFSFNVKNKSDIKIQIYDFDGNMVFEHTGQSNEGKFTYVWDMEGIEGKYGEGRYNVKVSATDSFGENSTLPVTVKGKVTGVDFTDNGDPRLVMGYGDGQVKVGLDLIAFISEKIGTPTADNNSGTGTDTGNGNDTGSETEETTNG
jgi:flagellar basal-body rod modification protein FlgD